MSTSAASVTPVEKPPSRLGARLLGLVPGLLLLFAVGYAGKFIEQSITAYRISHHKTLPNIEYVLWAILIGLIIANTVGLPRIFRAGVATYDFWLKLGIVLLGARFLIGDVLHLGRISLGLVAIEIALSLVVIHLLGRVFGLNPKLTSLLAVGSSICGVSAIIAAEGAIDADENDAAYAIAAILALGAISLFTFPLIGHALHFSDKAYGLWAGLAVDNTAEATAAGALYSDAAGKVAVLAKSTRNALIGFIVLGYAIYWSSRGQAQAVGNKAAFLWRKFPKFVLGFLLISALATWGIFGNPHPPKGTPPSAELTALANLSRWAFLLTFAGVGLRTSVRELGKQGWRPFVVCALGEVFVALLTLGLVFGAAHVFQL